MIQKIHNTQIIYTEAQKQIAEHISSFLEQQPNPARRCAVILISDEAVRDTQWQKEVRSLEKSVRLIPVGGTVDADYSDPEVIPPAIEELNFIRIDDDVCTNIWESIQIDNDFYNVRNTVLVNMDSWKVSGQDDAFLISEYFRVRKYRKTIRRKLLTENDPVFRKQLDGMQSYLNDSLKHARRIFLKKLRQRTTMILLALAIVGLVRLSDYMTRERKRAADETALLGKEPTEADAAENVIRILDGIDNKYIDTEIRARLMDELDDYLDMNWYTTPIGFNYRYPLSYAQIADNSRYLYTYAENGHLLKWDTWTGRIIENYDLSVQNVKAFHTSPSGKLSVYVTPDNYVMIGLLDGDVTHWYSNNAAFPFTEDGEITIVSDEDHFIVFDRENVFYYEVGETPRLRYYFVREIMEPEDYAFKAAEIDDDGFSAVFTSGNKIICYRVRTEESYQISLEASMDESCSPALKYGKFIFADKDGNIIVLDLETLESRSIGLILPEPEYLRFVDSHTLVYYDRILGTRLYETDQEAEIAEVFTSFDEISRLDAFGSTLICYANGIYICEPVDSLMPVRDTSGYSQVHVFTENHAESSGMVRSVSVTDENVIRLVLHVDTEDTVILLDGAHYFRVGDALTGARDYADEEKRYTVEPNYYEGKPVVVGIIDNGYGIVIGTQDGSFTELVFRNSGAYIDNTVYRIPSHSAVSEIIETDDCYLIKDLTGIYWKARLGWTANETPSLKLDQINAKLHNGVTKELLDSISQDTINDLGLVMMPGGDGKEWE